MDVTFSAVSADNPRPPDTISRLMIPEIAHLTSIAVSGASGLTIVAAVIVPLLADADNWPMVVITIVNGVLALLTLAIKLKFDEDKRELKAQAERNAKEASECKAQREVDQAQMARDRVEMEKLKRSVHRIGTAVRPIERAARKGQKIPPAGDISTIVTELTDTPTPPPEGEERRKP